MNHSLLRRLVRLPPVLLASALAPGFALAARQGSPRAMAAWCRLGARALGLRIRPEGSAPEPGALVVANHVGYLDILVLGALAPGRFVAKSEVQEWPLAGPFARSARTLFVPRDDPRRSRLFIERIAAVLGGGERVLLFAEAGVSSDGATLGPFRPMLFEACIRTGRAAAPVGIRYTSPADPRVWAWIEEPRLSRHLWNRLLPAAPVEACVRFGPPVVPRPGEGRKAFAARVREEVQGLLRHPG